DVRAAQGVHLHRTDHLRRRPDRIASLRLLLPRGGGFEAPRLADRVFSPLDLRLPGGPDRAGRRRDLWQSQAARGPRVPRPRARSAVARTRAPGPDAIAGDGARGPVGALIG